MNEDTHFSGKVLRCPTQNTGNTKAGDS